METTVITAVNTTWVLDPAHSELTFKIKHLGITHVNGGFRKFSTQIEGVDFNSSKVEVNIDAASVTTNDENRDNHLRSGEFFDVENHKEISFAGTSFSRVSDEKYKLTGMLTMKGISKEVMFDVEFGGVKKDPWGNEKAGFSLSGKINRRDWGLNWNSALDTGGMLLSDEVKVYAEVQFVKKA